MSRLRNSSGYFICALTAMLLLAMTISVAVGCDSRPETDDPGAGTGAAVDTSGPDEAVAGNERDIAPAALTTPAGGPVLLFTIGMHIEPLGAQPSTLVAGAGQNVRAAHGDYNYAALFNRHVNDIITVADIVEKHGGRMTIQTQSPFTTIAIRTGSTVLSDLAAGGHEIALHFHEDAHLGNNGSALPASTWCAVMQEEIGLIEQASGVDSVEYWSGGNLYPGLLDAAACAGLSVNSDWKNPQTQSTAAELTGINPWRPAGGTNGVDLSSFAANDPDGPVVFLPEGQYSRDDFGSMRRAEGAGGDEGYFQFLQESLLASLAAAQPGKVNVFHFTVHPGEFRGDPQQQFAVIDRFLTEVVDPLVASGQLRWSTFSGMASVYAEWETANPGADPRGAPSAPVVTGQQ